MVLGIAPAAIIDRQLPFEYNITSRSTDVVVMAQPVQNINHSAFSSMFEREKLSGNNFNDWFRQLKLVLRVEKKMFVIEQPLPAAPAADSEALMLSQWNAVYDAYNEVACLILGSMTPELHRQFENSSPYDMIKELKSMFEKQAGVERFDLIQTFHACKQKEGKLVAAYVLQMKGYVDQLERLGYVLLQDLTVGLILNGLTKYFARFGKDKQVYIPKPKNPKPSAKEHPAKDDTCHHCKEVGHWKRYCPVYLAELLKKKKQVVTASSSGKMTRKSFPHRPERATDLLGIIHTDVVYKAAMLDSESNKWIDAMNAEIQSMIDNMIDSWFTVGKSKLIYELIAIALRGFAIDRDVYKISGHDMSSFAMEGSSGLESFQENLEMTISFEMTTSLCYADIHSWIVNIQNYPQSARDVGKALEERFFTEDATRYKKTYCSLEMRTLGLL
ncbi:helitron helicase-like domain-containing protein [Tanacetum coccineum]